MKCSREVLSGDGGRLRGVLRRVLCGVYPELCVVCGRGLVSGERVMCMECDEGLPRSFSHRESSPRVSQRLGRVWGLRGCASWFHYDPTERYAALIRSAKYGDRPWVARYLGARFAAELAGDVFFEGIDVMVPVPLHWRRRMSRGFNQSEEIALGVSSVSGIGVSDALRAVRAHRSQTGFSGAERMENVRGVFGVRDGSELEGRHILMVDDVVTTGATLESALGSVLAACRPSAVSVLTLGVTRPRSR